MVCGPSFWGGVAQVVEQRNHNPRVGGSSPSAATSIILAPVEGPRRAD